MIGHSPGVVFDPTRHCHTTRPFPSAIFGPRPLARDRLALLPAAVAVTVDDASGEARPSTKGRP